MAIDLPFVLPFNVPDIKIPNISSYPNYSFYGVPFGIYAMMGITTVILATMTIYDSNFSSSNVVEKLTSQLPNLTSDPSSEPEEEEEEEEPIEEEVPIEEEKEEETKLFGGKKKTDKKLKGGKGKTKQNKEKQKTKNSKNKTKKHNTKK